jgi:hypothetical protein
VERLKKTSDPGPKLLDLGTCLGQDLRELAFSGVPVKNLYGADLISGFEAAGLEFFCDSDRFGPSNFITGNILTDDDNDALFKTRGTWDIVHIAMFLHIWDIKDQEKACENILKLLGPGDESLIFGTQTGTLSPGELNLKPPLCEPGEHRAVYRHSKETMIEMWYRVGKKLNEDIQVWAEYDEEERKARERGRMESGEDWEAGQRFFTGSEERRIFFTVKRVSQ